MQAAFCSYEPRKSFHNNWGSRLPVGECAAIGYVAEQGINAGVPVYGEGGAVDPLQRDELEPIGKHDAHEVIGESAFLAIVGASTVLRQAVRIRAAHDPVVHFVADGDDQRATTRVGAPGVGGKRAGLADSVSAVVEILKLVIGQIRCRAGPASTRWDCHCSMARRDCWRAVRALLCPCLGR